MRALSLTATAALAFAAVIAAAPTQASTVGIETGAYRTPGIAATDSATAGGAISGTGAAETQTRRTQNSQAQPFQTLAEGFGAIVFGAFEGQFSDVEYGVSSGGDVRLHGYSVGQYGGSGIVAGGDVTFSNGSVGAGGDGSIRAGGEISGDATAAAKLTSDRSAIAETAARREGFEALSTHLKGFQANGAATLQYGSLLLEGVDPKLNVFSFDAGFFENSGTIDIRTPSGATNLIRITGESIRFDGRGGQIMFNTQAGGGGMEGGGMGGGEVSGDGAARTLWHMPEALTLMLGGSRAPQGSILATLAGVEGGYGQMNGVLVADSFRGSTQVKALSTKVESFRFHHASSQAA